MDGSGTRVPAGFEGRRRVRARGFDSSTIHSLAQWRKLERRTRLSPGRLRVRAPPALLEGEPVRATGTACYADRGPRAMGFNCSSLRSSSTPRSDNGSPPESQSGSRGSTPRRGTGRPAWTPRPGRPFRDRPMEGQRVVTPQTEVRPLVSEPKVRWPRWVGDRLQPGRRGFDPHSHLRRSGAMQAVVVYRHDSALPRRRTGSDSRRPHGVEVFLAARVASTHEEPVRARSTLPSQMRLGAAAARLVLAQETTVRAGEAQRPCRRGPRGGAPGLYPGGSEFDSRRRLPQGRVAQSGERPVVETREAAVRLRPCPPSPSSPGRAERRLADFEDGLGSTPRVSTRLVWPSREGASFTRRKPSVRIRQRALWPNPNGADLGCEPRVRGFDSPRSLRTSGSSPQQSTAGCADPS